MQMMSVSSPARTATNVVHSPPTEGRSDMKRLMAAIALLVLASPELRAENARKAGSPRRSSQPIFAAKAGEFVVEPPTLICLGFEWEIIGDDNRNATVEVELPAVRSDGLERGHAAAADGRRANLPRAVHRCPTGSPEASSTSSRTREYEVRLTMKDPDGVSGQAVQTAKVRTRGEPKAAAGGRVLHVYPPTWRAAEAGAELHGPDGRLCRRRHGRLERRLAAQGGAGRHDPGARRPLQGRPAQLRRPAEHDVRRRLPADREGHTRSADRHQGGRRRRGDLRRRRRVPLVRRHGRRLSHLRGAHDPEHRGGVLGGREGRGGRRRG